MLNFQIAKSLKSISKIFILFFFISILECDIDKKARINFVLPLPNNFVGATIVESDGSTDLFEGTTTDTYTIALNSAPASSVTIAINFDNKQLKINESTTSPIAITFTTANWNIPQTVSVMAAYDSITEGNHKSVISHDTSSGNLLSPVIQIGNVVANITDNQGSRLTSSFQSGTVTIGGTNPLSVSLSKTVDASKSFAYCNFQMNNSAADRATTCQIASNGASVVIQSGNSGSGTVVNWYVVEFSTGAFVQRGSNSLLAAESTKTITLSQSVDLSRSFIIAYSRTVNTNSTIDEQRTLRYRFLTTSSIEIVRNENGIVTDFEWQVIQLDGGRVQSGISTILNNSSSISSTISSINLNNSFIIFNSAAGSGVGGVETDHYVQGYFNSSTQITFARMGTNDSVDVSWFAIEMVDGTTSQSGNVTVSSSAASTTTNLNAVDTTKTMIISSYQVETGSGGAATQDSGTFSSIFNNATTIQFERAGAESNTALITWFAVQFQ